MKISIITTVYKAERDLPRLLDSMMQQKSPELEFFLIDNGSPDRCGEICLEYAKRDSRFKVYTIKENVGYIRARNIGMQVCDGDYIGFCDSDDYLEPGGYDRAIDKIREKDCDLYITAYRTVFGNSEAVNLNPYPTGFYTGTDITEKILPQAFGNLPEKPALNGFAWKQIFKRSIILDNGLAFLPELQPYEDQIFNIDVIKNCGGIYIDDNIIYNYVVNEESITAKIFSDFDSAKEWNRLGLLYSEKKKRAVSEKEIEAYNNGALAYIYGIVLNMSKQKLGVRECCKRFSQELNFEIVKSVISKASRRKDKRMFLIEKSLKKKNYGLMFAVTKAALKMRG